MCKFNYGEDVRVVEYASALMKPSQSASVIGMRFIDDPKIAENCSCELNSWLVYVEFVDGSDKEIPEKYLIVDGSYQDENGNIYNQD